MKKILIISILAGLFLPAFVFGAVSYERSPSGYTIFNPVSFDVAFDNWEETGCETNFWGIQAYNAYVFDFFNFGCVASTTLSNLFIETLELGTYEIVNFSCTDDCNDYYGSVSLEYNNGEIIFEVVEEAPTGIFTITSANISDITDYIQELFAGSGLYPLVALIIGLPLAFWSIEKIVDLKDKKERKKRKLEMLKEFKTKKADWL